MHRSILPRAALLLPLAGLPWSSGAQDALQSPGSIAERVRQFLQGQQASATASVEVEVDTPDPRLRLPLCERSLAAFLPPAGKTSGRVTVGVRCGGSVPWTLYVPAQVRLLDRVVVARRAFPRGTLIRAQDLALERRDLARESRGYFLHPEEVSGKLAARNIAGGAVLSPGLLDRPLAVTRGDQVSIVAELGGVVARMQGRALESGSRGERIRVLTLGSGKELKARVVSAGRVKIDR